MSKLPVSNTFNSGNLFLKLSLMTSPKLKSSTISKTAAYFAYSSTNCKLTPCKVCSCSKNHLKVSREKISSMKSNNLLTNASPSFIDFQRTLTVLSFSTFKICLIYLTSLSRQNSFSNYLSLNAYSSYKHWNTLISIICKPIY